MLRRVVTLGVMQIEADRTVELHGIPRVTLGERTYRAGEVCTIGELREHMPGNALLGYLMSGRIRPAVDDPRYRRRHPGGMSDHREACAWALGAAPDTTPAEHDGVLGDEMMVPPLDDDFEDDEIVEFAEDVEPVATPRKPRRTSRAKGA